MARSVSSDSPIHVLSQETHVDEGSGLISAVLDEPLLVLTLGREGSILSAFSPLLPSKQQGVFQAWIGQSLARFLCPAEAATFENSLSQVKATAEPGQFAARIALKKGGVAARWVLTPVLALEAEPQCIVALAYALEDAAAWTNAAELSSDWQTLSTCSELQGYATQLSQITRNIRRTLDLETIWRQTVDGLGQLFQVERCWVCAYQVTAGSVAVAAEFCQSDQASSWQGQVLHLADWPQLQRAIATPSPVTARIEQAEDSSSLLAIATRYQEQINGLILLFGPIDRDWSAVELDLVNELADQVGTAIAHARLFGESHALASQLQQANARLVEKHRELEEARRQAEETRKQAEEASRLKSEFLANTSHELRTPLNGMIGFLKLVLDGMADDPAEQEEFIQEAHKSAIHLLQLINDVLDIAKIEAGKMQIDMNPINLRELLNDVENFIRPQAEQKQLDFKILLPPTRDEIILNGNYQRLLQVLLNLVGNAIKFTHYGEVRITAEIKPQRITFQGKTWPGLVKVSVSDTGIGVSLEKQDRLFQTFSQVDGERTRQYGGTGLGLAISQKLVEAMGGVVQFISMGEGLGSTVNFTALLYQEPVVVSAEPLQPVS
ncbi:MAG: GAF domain-containing protein [Cyanobacteria bacterium Co-bin13]|nr:GAF domain-containing protein [Cyanobacteria bacterium Co-bin13]